MNKCDAALVKRADSAVEELQRQQSFLPDVRRFYASILHYALISIYGSPQIIMQLTVICNNWKRTNVQAELYSNYLATLHFPAAQEYFTLINIIQTEHALPQSIMKVMIEKALSYDISETTRLLLYKIIVRSMNSNLFEQEFAVYAYALNDKQMQRKEREMVPYFIFLPFLQNEHQLFLLISSKFDKLKRHVARNFFFNAVAYGIYNERERKISCCVGQNLSVVYNILGDKKHFHCVFSCVAEYCIVQRSLLGKALFDYFLKAMIDNPLIGVYQMCRLVCYLCYNSNIFEHNTLPPAKPQNEQLRRQFLDMCRRISDSFYGGVVKLGDYFLLDDIFSSKEKYFVLLPYYQMMQSENFKVTDFMLELMGRVVSLDMYYFRDNLPYGQLRNLIMLAIPGYEMKVSDDLGVSSTIQLPFLLRKTNIVEFRKTLIKQLNDASTNIYEQDVCIFLQNVKYFCNLYEGYLLLVAMLQKAKHYCFFPRILDLVAYFIFYPKDMEFLYSTIMLLLTIYLSHYEDIERITLNILVQITFLSSPKSKHQIIRDILKTESQEGGKSGFYKFVQEQMAKDDEHHSYNIKNTVLLYYFNNKRYTDEQIKEQFIYGMTFEDLSYLANNYLVSFSLPEYRLAKGLLVANDAPETKWYLELKIVSSYGSVFLLPLFQKISQTREMDYCFAYHWAILFACSPELKLVNTYFKQQTEQSVDCTGYLLYILFQNHYYYALSRIYTFYELSEYENGVSSDQNMLLILCFPFFVVLNALLDIYATAKACCALDQKIVPGDVLKRSFDTSISLTTYLSALFYFFTDDRFFEVFTRQFYINRFSLLEAVSYTQFWIYANNFSVQQFRSAGFKTQSTVKYLRGLSKVFQYSFQYNCKVSLLISRIYASKLRVALPEYYRNVISLILASIRTNQQFSDVLSYYLVDQKGPGHGFQRNTDDRDKQIFDILRGAIEGGTFYLLNVYDYPISLNLQILDNGLPNREDVMMYYQDAKYIIEQLYNSDYSLSRYINYQILKYDLSKQVEFQFKSAICQSQSQQYFTISQILILLYQLNRHEYYKDGCMATMKSLLSEDKISRTWLTSISEYVYLDDLAYFKSFESITSFIPGFFFAYLETLRPDTQLSSDVVEHVIELSRSFIAKDFILMDGTLRINREQDFTSSEITSDAESSQTSASSNIPILTTFDERSFLSEAFLKYFLQFIAITKSHEVSDILVDHFSQNYSNVFITKLIYFICHNQHFLEKYGIKYLNITGYEKKINIISKSGSKLVREPSSNSTVFYKIQMESPVTTKIKKQKFTVGNVYEMSIKQFNFNVIEELIVNLALKRLVEVLSFLQYSTLCQFYYRENQQYYPSYLYFCNTQPTEYIYGFVIRSVLVYVLKRCLDDKILVPEPNLYESLYILLIDGIFIDCSDYRQKQSTQDSLSSNCKSEPSYCAPSSRYSESFFEYKKYEYLQLKIRENYYFDKLLKGRAGNTENGGTDKAADYNAVMYQCCEYLMNFKKFNGINCCIKFALHLTEFGILHQEGVSIPWSNSDQYYEYHMTTQFEGNKYLVDMLPIVYDKHFYSSMNNRRKILRFISIMVQLIKTRLKEYGYDAIENLLKHMFFNYCNQNLLLTYTSMPVLFEQQKMMESSILIILEYAINEQDERLLILFGRFIRVCKNSVYSQRFAWYLYKEVCLYVDCRVTSKIKFLEITSLTQFAKHLQFVKQQYEVQVPKLGIKLRCANTIDMQQNIKWAAIKKQLVDGKTAEKFMKSVVKNPGGDLYYKMVLYFLKDLYYHSGVQLKESDVLSLYSYDNTTKVLTNFGILKEQLRVDEYLAIICAYFVNIFFLKFARPQVLVEEIIAPLEITILFVTNSLSKDISFHELGDWMVQLYCMDYGVCNHPMKRIEPQGINKFIDFVPNKLVLLENLTILLYYQPLEFPVLLLMTEICTQLCNSNYLSQLENINMSVYLAKNDHARQIYQYLVGRYNYKGYFAPMYDITGRYQYLDEALSVLRQEIRTDDQQKQRESRAPRISY